MVDFNYLLDKVVAARFETEPFRHIYVRDFFSSDHFLQITSAPETAIPVQRTTDELVDRLEGLGYRVLPFPGCANSKEEYLASYREGVWSTSSRLTTRFGLALRLQTFQSPILLDITGYLNGKEFKAAIERKFEIKAETTIETGIQKYLDGYEISPHPDGRHKALTYMININTTPAAKQADIHTSLLRFRDDKRHISQYWHANPQLDRCWVPWDWCETLAQPRDNNSIVLFAPSDESLHAIRLSYDHLAFQRTQIFGNLWYVNFPVLERPPHDEVDRLSSRRRKS
jgi:hypothetical protein